MPLFLETSDLICQAEDTYNKNDHVVRPEESLCVEISHWVLPASSSILEHPQVRQKPGVEIAWIMLSKYS